jgi:hypothetical protein
LRRQWRLDRYEFPVIEIAVMAVPGNQRCSEFTFRFEVSNFPTQAPEVKIWDPAKRQPLALAERPKGSARVTDAFKDGWPGEGAPSVSPMATSNSSTCGHLKFPQLTGSRKCARRHPEG